MIFHPAYVIRDSGPKRIIETRTGPAWKSLFLTVVALALIGYGLSTFRQPIAHHAAALSLWIACWAGLLALAVVAAIVSRPVPRSLRITLLVLAWPLILLGVLLWRIVRDIRFLMQREIIVLEQPSRTVVRNGKLVGAAEKVRLQTTEDDPNVAVADILIQGGACVSLDAGGIFFGQSTRSLAEQIAAYLEIPLEQMGIPQEVIPAK